MTEIETRIDRLNDFLAHQGVGLGDAETPTTAVVVALPRAMDPIRLVGDEDKHATLLFFGEISTLPDSAKQTLIETLQNVSRLAMPFREEIVDVSRLGNDNPPALVAMLSNMNLGSLRKTMLINPAIGEFLNNAQQYPSYTPHVTLAYPDYQGEAELRKVIKGLYKINFDRLALWWGGEQIEFSLDASMAESNDMMQSDAVGNFLTQQGLTLKGSSLSHAERTVQDVFDGLSAEKKDVVGLIVGAAIDDIELPEDPDVTRVYNSMTAEEKNLLDFLVGGALSDESNIQHSDADSLAHFGVKGMKWGVRRDSSGSGSGSSKLTKSPYNTHAGRKAARAQVRAGTATLGTAHLAALKSKGHRAVNAFLGDKTYWKRTAAILGLTVAGVGAAFAAPAVMPAGMLAGIGAHAVGTTGVVGGHVLLSGHLTTTVAIGKALVTSGVIKGTILTSTLAKAGNMVDNTVRAVRGNARINKQYAALGQHIKDRQTAGTKQVQKVLVRNGGIKKGLLHSDLMVDNFLTHQGLQLPNHV